MTPVLTGAAGAGVVAAVEGALVFGDPGALAADGALAGL